MTQHTEGDRRDATHAPSRATETELAFPKSTLPEVERQSLLDLRNGLEATLYGVADMALNVALRYPDSSEGIKAASNFLADTLHILSGNELAKTADQSLMADEETRAIILENRSILRAMRDSQPRPSEPQDPVQRKQAEDFRVFFGFARDLSDIKPVDRPARYAGGMTPAQRTYREPVQLDDSNHVHPIGPDTPLTLLVEAALLVRDNFPRETESAAAWLSFHLKSTLRIPGQMIDNPACFDHGMVVEASLGTIYTQKKNGQPEKVIGVGGLYGYPEGPQDALWGGQLALTPAARRDPLVVIGVFNHLVETCRSLGVKHIYLFTEDQAENRDIQRMYEGLGARQMMDKQTGEPYVAQYVGVRQRFYDIRVADLEARLERSMRAISKNRRALERRHQEPPKE